MLLSLSALAKLLPCKILKSIWKDTTLTDAMTNATNPVTPAPIIPTPLKAAHHIGLYTPLPFVDLGDGSALQLLHVDLNAGLWIVRVRFDPGCIIDTHYHTGSVYAVTLQGHWYYEEYPDAVNGPGSYLFEPAGSVHTLRVSDDGAEVWFAVHGANVNVDKSGNVLSIVDASTVLQAYRAMAAESGSDLGTLLVIGE